MRYGLTVLAALPWAHTENERALMVGAFGDEMRTLAASFLTPFMTGQMWRPGLVIGFAVAAALTIRFFSWFKQKVW